MKYIMFLSILIAVGCSPYRMQKRSATKSLDSFVKTRIEYGNKRENIYFRVNIVDNKKRTLGVFFYELTCVKDTEFPIRILDISVRYQKNNAIADAPIYRIEVPNDMEPLFGAVSPGKYLWVWYRDSFIAKGYPKLDVSIRQYQRATKDELEKRIKGVILFSISNCGGGDTAIISLNTRERVGFNYNIDTNRMTVVPVKVDQETEVSKKPKK